MMNKKALTATVAALALNAPLTIADTVDNAHRLCSVFDGTGLLSKPCDVSGWNQAVDVSMDTSSSEARKICSGVADMMAQKNIRFDRGWKIRIYSPFSNGNTIATCSLPN
ncbi:MAG: hypothetical protein MI864_23980 [Pseudomonadales bacterium]|nr:hypothetical protein [Pseudomonadales bacterium]